MDPETGEQVGVKRFHHEQFDQTIFIREVETLAKLNHPCILRIRGWRPPIGKDPAEIRTSLAENGSLAKILEKVAHGTRFTFWNPTGKGILICGIALGLRFVHSKGIIHGDLKPSNILVNGGGEAVIGDFGISRFESNDYTLTPESGTVNYAAPELFEEKAIPTHQIDVFAFGLVMYEILTGKAVFPSSGYAFPILKQIKDAQMPAVPDECGGLMQDLIRSCWAKEPGKRPTVDDILCNFKAEGFHIVPKADPVQLGLYVHGIEHWELEEAAQSQSK
jgi:serine/threonine protein kinase